MLQLVETARRELTADDEKVPRLTFAIATLIALFPLSLLGGGLVDIFASTIAILFLCRSLIQRDFAWIKEPWIVLGLVLWGYLVLRGVLSVQPAKSAGAAAAWGRFIILGAALHVMLPRSAALQSLLLISTIAMALFGASDALLQFLMGTDLFGQPMLGNRLTGPLTNPAIGFVILFGGMSAIVFFFSRAVSSNDRAPVRVASFAALLVIYAAIALSGERMPFLQACLALAILVAVTGSLRTLVVVGVTGAVMISTIFAVAPDAFMRQVSVVTKLQEAKSSDYGKAMLAGHDVALDNPIFGVGLKNYNTVCPDHVAPENTAGCRFHHPHHLIIQLVAETGIIGLVGFFTLFALALQPAVAYLLQYDERPLLSGSTMALLILLFPLMTFGSFFTNWRAALIWFLIGVTASLSRTLTRGSHTT